MSGIKLEVGKFYRSRDGRKVGPIRTRFGRAGYPFDAQGCDSAGTYCGTGQFYRADGTADDGRDYDLIAEWTDAPTGPVRTVTRKEIVEGDYGDLSVTHQQKIVVVVPQDAARIRAAASQMIEIADALEAPTR